MVDHPIPGRTIRATAPQPRSFAVETGPGREISAPTRPGQGRVSDVIRAAVTRGALTRERAGFYLAKAADNPAEAEAVADLVSRLWSPDQNLPPEDAGEPDGVTASLWPGDPRGRAVAASSGGDPDDVLYESLYPDNEQAAVEIERRTRRQGRDAARFNESQHRYDNTLTASGQGGGEIVDHGRTTVPAHEHSHPHPDYAGGVHSHPHAHVDDANHRPHDVNHQHKEAAAMGNPAVTAGISRRPTEHAAAARTPAAGMTDDELLALLFGGPPGE
jgi:hypothetical protein